VIFAPLRLPRGAGQRRQGHHVEEPGHVVFGCVEVGVGVEPHHPQPVRAHAAHRAQSAVAVPGQHEGESAACDRGANALGQPAVELDRPRHLRQRRVDAGNDVGGEVGGVDERPHARSHRHVRQPVVERQRDRPHLRHGGKRTGR
jgi:hypothetical protein